MRFPKYEQLYFTLATPSAWQIAARKSSPALSGCMSTMKMRRTVRVCVRYWVHASCKHTASHFKELNVGAMYPINAFTRSSRRRVAVQYSCVQFRSEPSADTCQFWMAFSPPQCKRPGNYVTEAFLFHLALTVVYVLPWFAFFFCITTRQCYCRFQCHCEAHCTCEQPVNRMGDLHVGKEPFKPLE